MKARRIFIFCVVILLLALLVLPLFTGASAVYFTMINANSPEPLSNATMPFLRDGIYHVPVSTLERLGIAFSSTTNGFRLFSSGNLNHYVEFDLEAGANFTADGSAMLVIPVAQGGTFFLPVGTAGGTSPLLAFFGVGFRVISTSPAPTLRLYRGLGNLSHDAVLQDAEALFGLNERFQNFVNPGWQNPPPLPPQPTPTPEPTPEPTPSVPTLVSLSFVGLNENTGDLLDALEEARILSAFFVTAEDIYQQPDLIRRIAGQGHQLGIFLEEDAAQDYQRAAALLFEVARLRTVFVSAQNQELLAQARDLGLLTFDVPALENIPPLLHFSGNVLLGQGPASSDTVLSLPQNLRQGPFIVQRFFVHFR